jgi:SAM-dependent methyltransferase
LDPREYERIFQVEDHHWWYRGMEAITRAMLARWYRIPSRLFILDAGCGTGAAASTFLADYGTVTGIDIHPLALKFSRKRNLSRLACASVSALPFDSSQFDLITSFDVLYERAVADDLAALREFVRVLVPGGRVFLRLPAYDWLRGQHDKVVHTNKRYTANRVEHLLAESGLSVERVSFANMFLFPVALLKRLGERLFPIGEENSDLDLNIGLLNGILLKILSSEAPLVATRGLPFGLSVVAVARKG